MTEISDPHSSPEVAPHPQTQRIIEIIEKLPGEASFKEVKKANQELRDSPVTVVRNDGSIEGNWVINAISPQTNDETGQRVVWVHQKNESDDPNAPTSTKGVSVEEFLSWQTPEGAERAARMGKVDWGKVPAIEGLTGVLSVKELEQLREDQLSSDVLGAKTPEEFASAREKKAQELVDLLLPSDKEPSDPQAALRYRRQREILKEDLVIGENGFREHKRLWFERYDEGAFKAGKKLSASERHEDKQSVYALRREYADRLAKRSRSMSEGLWTSKKIANAREELADVIGAEATQMYEEGLEKGVDKDTLVKEIDDFVKQQTDELLNDMHVSRMASIASRNRFVRWGIEKWASLGGPDQMQLSLKEKIKTRNFWIRTGILGGVSALVGGAAVVAAGAAGVAGAGAAIVFGTGLVSRTVARNVASLKLDNAANDQTLADAQYDQHSNDIDTMWETSQQTQKSSEEGRVSHTDLLNYIDTQSEKIRTTNTKKLMGNIAVGIAFGAFGAGVGAAVQMAAPHVAEFFGSLHGRLGSHTDSSASPTMPSAEPTGSKPPLPTAEQSSEKPPLPTVEDSSKPPLPTVDTDHTAPGSPPPEVLPPITPESPHYSHEVKLWQGAATERVLERAYPGIKNPFVRINELYDKFGKEGVFEVKNTEGRWVPVRLSEHDPNNIWIMRDSGTVRLTAEAQNYLDKIYHPQNLPDAEPSTTAASVEAANKLINTHELVPANTVSKGESWTRTLNELKEAKVIDIPEENYAKLLRVAGPDLAKMHYSDGTPVAYYHRIDHDWRMYESPNRRLLPQAIRLLERLARQDAYAKAA